MSHNFARRTKSAGLHGAKVLNASIVETILHGRPDCDARTHTAASEAANESRMLLERANAEYAKTHPETPKPAEEAPPMNKRQRAFHELCSTAGLKIVDWSAQAGRVGGLTQAANGAKRRFTVSGGPKDDRRGDLNLLSAMRTFARENIESLTPIAQAMVAAANDPTSDTTKRILKVATAPAAPRVHRRVPEAERRIDPTLTLAKGHSFTPAYTKAPAPPAAAPATASTPTKTVPPKETPMTTEKKNGSQNKLSRAQFFALTKWVEAADASKSKTLQEFTDAAGAALSVKVSITTMREACDILGLELFKKPAKPLSEAAIVAKALAGLMKALAHPIPADLAALAAKAGA
jgi:hypothetical protein